MDRRRLRWIVTTVAAGLLVAGLLVALVGPGEAMVRRLWNGSRPPVRIGLLHSRSGSLAISEASVLEAELLAVEEINASGGIGGRRIDPIQVDCRSDPAEYAAAAARTVDREGAVALFAGWTSESRKAMLPVVEERPCLLFFPGNFEGFEQSRHIVYAGGSANQTVLPAVRWAYDTLQARRFYIVGVDEIWSRSCSEMAKDAVRAIGAEVVAEDYSPPARPSIDATIESIQRLKPDVVLNFLFGEANGSFYRGFQRAGLSPATTPTIAFGFGEDEARSFVLSDLAGHHAAWNYFQSLARPENQEFIRKFRARYGDSRTVGDSMVAAYNAVLLWAQSAREVDSVEVGAILSDLDRQSLDGPDGIVSVDTESRIAWRPSHIGRLRPEGQFEIVWSIPRPVRPVLILGTRTVDQWRAFQSDLQTRWGGRWSRTAAALPAPKPGPEPTPNADTSRR